MRGLESFSRFCRIKSLDLKLGLLSPEAAPRSVVSSHLVFATPLTSDLLTHKLCSRVLCSYRFALCPSTSTTNAQPRPLTSCPCAESEADAFASFTARLVVFQQSHFIHHIVSTYVDIVNADSRIRA